MSIFFQRFFLLLLAAIIQRSFLDILWPTHEAPVLIIAVIISLVFLFGFARGLGWVLLTIFLYTLLGDTETFPVFAVGIAYGTSFLSRRLVIERWGESSFGLSLVAAVSVILYLFFLTVGRGIEITTLMVIANMVAALIVFPLVFSIMRVREKQIQESLRSEFRGLRT